ncbi:hypothetical protein BBBOND_0111340 [Babesia bigemina]|uniref:Uncharacterized protein n=1 Tax=Babesia bigemina TaxID=5866 RepID=A0A061D265_BABBI|nr:hypothetical protein BBBOND_0111340 [Babesia bigemina]CDR94836.1 hypothetical protein BBBOND_0111340 [Babesia bigemina]|eukprot:XP_012767022.1 hypothetical protein BBBOND_0111340 [Babesia bigemina]
MSYECMQEAKGDGMVGVGVWALNLVGWPKVFEVGGFIVNIAPRKMCFCSDGSGDCKDPARCIGIGLAIAFAGFIGFSALLVLVLYIMGRQYDVSLGTIFRQIRDGFRDSKPKLQ